MKKRIALFLGVALGAIGCTSTKGPKEYQADSPPPISKGAVEKPKGPAVSRVTPAKNDVSANSITEANLYESARRLDSDMREERGAMSKLGR